MNRKKFFIPTNGPNSWRQFLAKPAKQWKKGYSAMELAYCWEDANGFPENIITIFCDSKISLFKNMKLLFAFPEYKVALPGGQRDSQNDIYIIAKSNNELISIMVEGKVSESFGEIILDWGKNSSINSGKPKRLDYLLKKLNLNNNQVQQIKYQLLHRTVSAILEAQRIGAKNALMLVHSFSQTNQHFNDFEQFVKLFGLTARINSIAGPHQIQGEGIDLYFCWANS
jgi:hypothetical protein